MTWSVVCATMRCSSTRRGISCPCCPISTRIGVSLSWKPFTESELLPRLQTVPAVLGVPLFVSPAGLELMWSLLLHPLRVYGLSLVFINPGRACRALLDTARLVRLLAGTY